MRKLPWTYPSVGVSIRKEAVPSDIYGAIRGIVRAVEKFRTEVATVVNFNSVEFTSQNSQPTDLENGEMRVWEDADAAAGQPTHYLMFKDSNGTVVTFASEETA